MLDNLMDAWKDPFEGEANLSVWKLSFVATYFTIWDFIFALGCGIVVNKAWAIFSSQQPLFSLASAMLLWNRWGRHLHISDSSFITTILNDSPSQMDSVGPFNIAVYRCLGVAIPALSIIIYRGEVRFLCHCQPISTSSVKEVYF